MSHPKGHAPNQAIEVGGAADGRISNKDTSRVGVSEGHVSRHHLAAQHASSVTELLVAPVTALIELPQSC